jgi:hypothetical protein
VQGGGRHVQGGGVLASACREGQMLLPIFLRSNCCPLLANRRGFLSKWKRFCEIRMLAPPSDLQQKEDAQAGGEGGSGSAGGHSPGPAAGGERPLGMLRTFGQRQAKVDPVSDDAPMFSTAVLKLIAGRKGK